MSHAMHLEESPTTGDEVITNYTINFGPQHPAAHGGPSHSATVLAAFSLCPALVGAKVAKADLGVKYPVIHASPPRRAGVHPGGVCTAEQDHHCGGHGPLRRRERLRARSVPFIQRARQHPHEVLGRDS